MLFVKKVERVNLTPPNEFSRKKINLESSELPYEDLFKATEDCGAKVNEGVAKCVNSACTKRPAKYAVFFKSEELPSTRKLRFSQGPSGKS